MVMKLASGAGIVLIGAATICPICLHRSSAAVAPNETQLPSVSAMRAEADTARARLAIKGMTCASCATTARIALERSEGVYRAQVSYDSAFALVHYDPAKTKPPEFIAALKKLTGYEAVVVQEPSTRERQ